MLARSTTLDYGHIQNVQALHTTHSVTITIRGVFFFLDTHLRFVEKCL